MSILRLSLAAAASLVITAPPALAAQDVVDGFVARSFTAANGQAMPYRLFIPDAGAREQPLPLVLYLHGGGGVGTDNRKQISGGNTAGTHTWTTSEAQRRHPAFVLAPQLPQNRPSRPGGADGWSSSVETVLEIVAAVSREFAIDSNRLYVTGQSLGGYGTWEFISRHPQMFAAAVPLCGGGDAARVVAARTLTIWAFHGAKDPLVPVERSRELVAALRRVGGSVKYTEYPDVGHDVWTRAYAERELVNWLFSQRRGGSTLIRNASVIDGSGAAARTADVRIAGDRIVAVGRLTPEAGDRIYDARGLTLAPGFIDTHSHHDRGLDTARDAIAMVSQGVTTIVVGQDGGGIDLAGLFARLERQPAAVNVASYAGHGAIRDRVMGKDFGRAATAAEIQRMQAMLATEMDAGALGLSTGLEYDPGIYSTPEEVVALAKVAGAAGGRYASHIRSEDRWFWDALDELIAIGRQHRMSVHVSHIKLGMRDLWGQAAKLIGVLDRARADGVQLTADIYPYTYWQSNLGVLYPKRNFADRAETEFVLSRVALADDIIFNSFRAHPDYAGKTLAQVAALRGTPAEQTLMDLLAEPGGESAGIVAKGMSDADVERLIQWPFANVCSDGQSRGLHPRGFGAFARVLGPWVREKRLFSIEEGVRKMSSLPAANAAIVTRGLIAPDYFADLVVFDPSTIADRADFGHAQDLAVGVRTVWVNGEIVFDNGRASNVYAGRPLRRSAK